MLSTGDSYDKHSLLFESRKKYEEAIKGLGKKVEMRS